ncbi:MAG: alanine racemase [Balneolaceae bacterium]|nr:MAG: alanine racemase [Balneolaceae bacterium]
MTDNSPHKPVLLLDEARCKKNIERMVQKATASNCDFRPHFKTHQSARVGEWFREKSITGITVSSVSMAQYFHEAGWNDITIAFPFFKGQIDGLKQLNRSCKLRLFVNSTDDVRQLSESLTNEFRVYIELNTGSNRSGIHHENTPQINSIIETCTKFENVQFHGFYVHHGDTYKARSKEEITELIAPTLSIYKKMNVHYPEAKFSLGDTPSASVLTNFDDIDELTPGNFVFYDWMQVCIGSCTLNDVALFALLPVAQVSKEINKAIILGGAVHMSKDFVEVDDARNYGQVVNIAGNEITPVPLYLSALSQEHGAVSGNVETITGNHLVVCPIHSCLTANLNGHYVTRDGKIIEKRILS